jgi:hypothetical protein
MLNTQEAFAVDEAMMADANAKRTRYFPIIDDLIGLAPSVSSSFVAHINCAAM